MNFYTALSRRTTTTSSSTARCSWASTRSRIEAADGMVRTIPPELLLRARSPPMADWLEGLRPDEDPRADPLRTWQEIIDTPLPEDQALYCVTTAMIHYAKGVAYAATGRVAGGRRAARPVRGGRRRACPRHAACSEQHLPRHPGRRRRDAATASSSTARATTRPPSPTCAARSSWTTACPTTSPGPGCSRPATPTARCCWSRAASRRPRRSTAPTWGWTTRLPRACQHPENVWSLHGYHECLHAPGQARGRDGQAAPRPGRGPRRRADHGLLLLPDERRGVTTVVILSAAKDPSLVGRIGCERVTDASLRWEDDKR